MAGRGQQSFKKRQKEQQRKEKQQEKFAKRVERKRLGPAPPETDEEILAARDREIEGQGSDSSEDNPADSFDRTTGLAG